MASIIKNRLATLETTIERGKQTFVSVGVALAEIKNERLWQPAYRSFEDYCSKKWGWGKSYAYNLINAANIVKALPEKVSTIVESEGNARAIAKAEPEQRAEILETISANGPVTAKAIQAEVSKRLPVPKKPSRQDDEPARVHSADEAPEEDGAPRKTKDGLTIDATGGVIPLALQSKWDMQTEDAETLLQHISEVRCVLEDWQDSKYALVKEVSFSSALASLNQAYVDVKRAKPYAICPTCHGRLLDSCGTCHGVGWVSQFFWKRCVPEETRKMRKAAHAKA